MLIKINNFPCTVINKYIFCLVFINFEIIRDIQMARFKIIIVFFLVSSLMTLFFGCSQAKLPPCVPKSSQGIIIRWGEINTKNNMETYYELKDNCNIQLAVHRENASDTTIQKIGRISPDEYCNLYRLIQDAITKTQALNSPGDISNYVEYIDKSNKVYFRALWNSEYTNAGNRQFRKVFDSLQAVVSKLI